MSENKKYLQDLAYDYLHEMIKTGKFEYNKIYSETKIAQNIGISRTPVKDALRRLSQNKIIDILPNKGFRIHEITAKDIINTYQARISIEGFCAISLRKYRSEPRMAKYLESLKNSVESMYEAIKNGASDTEILEYDIKFHETLVKSLENEELYQLYESYHHRLYFIAVKSFEEGGRPAAAYFEHQKILEDLTDPTIDDFSVYMDIIRHMDASKEIALRLL